MRRLRAAAGRPPGFSHPARTMSRSSAPALLAVAASSRELLSTPEAHGFRRRPRRKLTSAIRLISTTSSATSKANRTATPCGAASSASRSDSVWTELGNHHHERPLSQMTVALHEPHACFEAAVPGDRHLAPGAVELSTASRQSRLALLTTLAFTTTRSGCLWARAVRSTRWSASPIVDLGEIVVVRPAEEGNVRKRVVAAETVRMSMVEFETDASAAAPAVRGDETALVAVPLADRAPDRRRDVTRGRPGVGLAERLAGSRGARHSPRLQPLQLLRDCGVDDGREIAGCD